MIVRLKETIKANFKCAQLNGFNSMIVRLKEVNIIILKEHLFLVSIL